MQEPSKSDPSGAERFGAATHEVFNQPRELTDFNLFAGDVVLRQAAIREGAAFAVTALEGFGARMGKASTLELGVLANKFAPELDTHDRYGRRIDHVWFHPAYHELMRAGSAYLNRFPRKISVFLPGFFFAGVRALEVAQGGRSPTEVTSNARRKFQAAAATAA